MSCQQYATPNVIRITSITQADGNYLLNTISDVPLRNGSKYVLIIPDSIMPAIATIGQVFLNINSNAYPLYERQIGNYVYSDQLDSIEINQCGNRVMRIVYGTNPVHFKVISHCLRKSSIIA